MVILSIHYPPTEKIGRQLEVVDLGHPSVHLATYSAVVYQYTGGNGKSCPEIKPMF
jgi:hypothetical protein